MEPLESLRYLSWLKADGALVTSADPLVNINNYPDMEKITSSIKNLPVWRLVEAAKLAKEAGLAKTVNTVMVGAASRFLPLKSETLEKTIAEVFSKKDDSVVQANAKAFKLGQDSVK
jgi:indolepyruvate ferredoxin oxidoreductase beta subunit